eukprot:342927_1
MCKDSYYNLFFCLFSVLFVVNDAEIDVARIKKMLFRMVFWLNKSYQYDRSLCEYVVNQLGLDESMLKEVQTYRCQPPKNRSLAPNAFKYWKKKIKNESISRLLATKK